MRTEEVAGRHFGDRAVCTNGREANARILNRAIPVPCQNLEAARTTCVFALEQPRR
jgi:hypothetical protein